MAGSCAPGPAGGLAWLGVLEGLEVVTALAMGLMEGPDFLVYSCVAVGRLPIAASTVPG